MGHKNERWIRNEDIPLQECAPGVKRKILAYCNEMMCVENHFDKGAVGQMHSHPHTQITYIAEGVFEFTIGEETRLVKQGDTLLKQDGIIHGCTCLEKGILLDFFNPMREEFVEE